MVVIADITIYASKDIVKQVKRGCAEGLAEGTHASVCLWRKVPTVVSLRCYCTVAIREIARQNAVKVRHV